MVGGEVETCEARSEPVVRLIPCDWTDHMTGTRLGRSLTWKNTVPLYLSEKNNILG